MSTTPEGGGPAPGGPRTPDLAQPDDTLQAVGAVSLRLLAGAVSKRTMEQLQRTVQQSPSEFPWQVVTQAVLAEPVDAQKLVQQGLQAQRDWIVRGGRERPATPLGQRTKGFVARLVAQLIFGVIFAAVVVAALLLLKHKLDWFDIYRVLDWFRGLFGAAR
ncbi:MAG: hypothetical protein HS113_31030 [Verrucomicrobiales bacterium]|jgi:hypothetical protein|nr:hypothetical protein [Verrucomicrobiales bacterium]